MSASLGCFNRDDPANQAVPFSDVLRAELHEIEIARQHRRGDTSESSVASEGGDAGRGNEVAVRATAADLVGLAFSGGGIRSATFNLGILQALSENEFLSRIDYLSTVSGGGYIGGWLAGCLKTLSNEPQERAFQANPTGATGSKESKHITALRRYSNYLTPRLGFLGADSWTMIAIYLRNLFLNLVIIIGTLTAVLIVPAIIYFLSFESYNHYSYSWARAVWSSLILLISLLTLAAVAIGLNLKTCEPVGVKRFGWLTSLPGVQIAVILPTIVAVAVGTAWMVAAEWNWAGHAPALPIWIFAGIVMNSIAWFLGLAVTVPFIRDNGEPKAGTLAQKMQVVQVSLLRVFSVIVAGAVGGLLLYGVHLLTLWLISSSATYALYWWKVICWVPPSLVGVLLITLTVQTGIANVSFSEQNREWFGRLGAYFLMYTLGWVALFLIAWPHLKDILNHAYAAGAALVAWSGSTVLGVFAGSSSKTGKSGSKGWDLVARIGPYMFAVGLLIGISLGVQKIHAMLGKEYPDGHLLFATFIILAIIVMVLSTCLDINLFSMNLFYRNRLVRCYLGAARKERRQQKFTGFDPEDDFLLAALRADAGYFGPYPIVNTALNLVHGSELAWQERKAEPFIFSPLYSGFDVAIERRGRTKNSGQEKLAPNGYRPTECYAYPNGGVTVGTVMAISGAAASPNMGYHSSPAVTFLMTVFNVRLGWWMGNPRHRKTWFKSSPKASLLYLIFELLGFTNDKRGYVYLSDGGHFENLGIYELIRRQCRLIIACDAGQDAQSHFDDLGSAIQKCRTDFGVEIAEMDLKSLFQGPDKVHCTGHYAIGKIVYTDKSEGTLLYVKPSLTGRAEESVDIMNYQLRHELFPHEPTSDQWFGESQFESYRKLGYIIGRHLFEEDETRSILNARKPQAQSSAQKA